jgi:glycerol-3-phosphate dehydrogenase
MKRNLKALGSNFYDLVIVGGGIYGAAIAWDAALRGLRVCLVEKSDFSSATSANSLKIIHGGLRYLQHADFRRMRESIREQRTLMRIAPHLVHPLPVLIPTYGHGFRGKEILSTAVLLTRLIGFDRDRRGEPGCATWGRVVSRQEVLRLLPGIEPQGLTGGVIFYDAQVYNSERLLLSFLRSAAEAGADLGNYAEVTGFLEQADSVAGVKGRDALTGDHFEVRGRTVVLACGPWTDRVTSLLTRKKLRSSGGFAKAVNIVTRLIFKTYAVGISARDGYRDSHALRNKRNRLLFIAPWRDRSLIGTAYVDSDEDPDQLKVTGPDIQSFLDQINNACPAADLKREEITFVHGGLVPISSSGSAEDVELAKHYRIRDHQDEGVKGLISVIGVKYTTARDVAEKAVDQVFRSWGRKPPNSPSPLTPLHGGQIQRFDAFLERQIAGRPHGLGAEAVRRLVYNYGSAYPEVLRYLNFGDRCLPPADDFTLLKAEVLHGVRMEMAQKLSDVIFRRTELGTAGHPGNQAVRACADVMSAELGWSPSRTQQELQEVNDLFVMRQ